MRIRLTALFFAAIYLQRFVAGGELADLFEKARNRTTQPTPPVVAPLIEKLQPGDVSEIGIERTPCHGTCPVYTFIAKSDGSCSYHGERNTEIIGDRTGKISERGFDHLAQLVRETGYMDLPNEYTKPITDFPTCLTTVVLDGHRKIIRNYADAGPARLWAIEQLIDKLQLEAEWDPKPPVRATPTTEPVTPPAHPATPPSPAHSQAIPGVGNFAQVSSVLYRGEQPTTEGFLELRRRGVRTIVSLRSFHGDQQLLVRTGLRYVRISGKAWHPEDDDIVRFLKIVEDPDNQPVFVHCMQGADRTGMMVAAYRMVEQLWTPDDAIAEMQNFGFHPVWNRIEPTLRAIRVAEIRHRLKYSEELPVRTMGF